MTNEPDTSSDTPPRAPDETPPAEPAGADGPGAGTPPPPQPPHGQPVEAALENAWRKTRQAVAAVKFQPRATIHVVQALLDWSRRTFPATLLDRMAVGLVRSGHYGLVAAQVLCILFGLTAAFKLGNWILALYGIGAALVLVILQYTAGRFLNAGDALVHSSPGRLRSPAFLDCLAVLSEAVGIVVFLAYLLLARRLAQWSLIWVGLGGLALFDALAFIALHPSLTNTSVSDQIRAGEEAIGIMSFFVKAAVRIVPIAFGIGTVIGAVGLFFATLSLMRTGLIDAGRESLRLIGFCAALPFVSYVLFAFYHLAIDVLRAILVLPDKLDASRP
ncbi:MAG: hypothetical protein JW951_07885 [Lentisphaerae bacterium]|nr:hypothetical protein [Lentisphaerota bacterium]